MKYICTKCGKTEDVSTKKAACDCGGLWKLDFTPAAFDLKRIRKETWGLFRYRDFMPVEGDAWEEITMGEGMTPIISLNPDVSLKMEYYMPTLSFKDRGAAMLVSHCRSIGIRKVVQDSSGNAGNSVAAYCARAGIQCEIFVPEGTSPKKITMIRAHGARVTVVPGSRDHCADVCRAKVMEEQVYYANHVFNPFFYQGTKTYIYEVYEQLGRIPENLFVPVGNGTLYIGMVLALEELLRAGLLERFPQIYAVQSEHCAPLVQAVERTEKDPARVVPNPTMAEGIAIGVPMRGREILEMGYRHGIRFITAPEDGILSARRELAEKGIYCEHTTAATYAAYLAHCCQYGPLRDCLIPMCGAGIKSDH